MKEISITTELIRNSRLQDVSYCIREVLERAEDDTYITFEKADYDLRSRYAAAGYTEA